MGMTTLSKAFCVLGLVLLAPLTQAQEEKHRIDQWLEGQLEKNHSTAGMCDALHQAGVMWDEQMNVSYKYLIEKFNAEQKADLQKSQRAWLAFRDAESKVQSLLADPYFGSIGRVDAANEYYEMIKSRALKLTVYEEALREILDDIKEPEPTPQQFSTSNGESKTKNYYLSIGDSLSDVSWSVYQGNLANLSGIFTLQWLPEKKVRGFFYPEGKMLVYRFYGENYASGKVNLQVFLKDKMIASGDVSKSKENGKLAWSGSFTSPKESFETSFTKLNAQPSQVKSSTSYRLVKGFTGESLEMTWHQNDTFSGYIEGLEDHEVFFSGINYRKGWMFMHESGHFGDNEGLIGAHLLLQKASVNGGLVWKGYRYHNNGTVTSVAFGRISK